MWQYMNYRAHEMLKKARKRGYKNILDRWNNDKYSKSLSDIGSTEEQISQYDEIALEDHSDVATKLERSRKEKSWKLSLNAEGIQGPWNQRSDFKEAKQTCKRLYYSTGNKFERFRGFFGINSQIRIRISSSRKLFFLNDSNFGCVHVNVPWTVCAHAIPFRMLWLP